LDSATASVSDLGWELRLELALDSGSRRELVLGSELYLELALLLGWGSRRD
jgi:hypothetical protein